MKKSFLYAGLALVASLFMVSCEKGGQTPETDSTKLWPAVSGEYWGYINNSGKLEVSATYSEAERFSCGYALVRISGGNLFFIDAKGQMQTAAPTFDRVGTYFYYDHNRYQINGMWGMFNAKFETVIQPVFYSLGSMSDAGLATCKQTSDGKWGYVDKKGQMAIAPQFDYAYTFQDGAAVVEMGDNYGLIDKSGSFLITPMYKGGLSSLGESRIGFRDEKTGKMGMLDQKGNVIVAAMYDGGSFFADNGLIPVSQGKFVGYLDKNGNIKLPLAFNQASPFYEGYAWIQRAENSNAELIDTKGNNVLTLGQDEEPYTNFHNGLALVYNYKSRQYRYIDKKGSTIYAWSTGSSSYAPAKAPAAGVTIDVEKLFRNTRFGYRFED